MPVRWAVSVALAELWQACGVRPAAVVGHSAAGKMAAAVVSGELSLEDGAKAIAKHRKAGGNLPGSVPFKSAVDTLASHGHRTFLEISAHPVLAASIKEILDAAGAGPEVSIIGSLQGGDDGAGGVDRFLGWLGQAFAAGLPVDWPALFADSGARQCELPTYAFRRERFWLAPPAAATAPAEDEADAEFWAAVEQQDKEALTEALGVDAAALDPVLPALASWRTRKRAASALDGLRYRTVWRAVGGRGTARLAGSWLVVAPAGEAFADDVTAAVHELDSAGAHSIRCAVDTSATDRTQLADQLREASGCAPGAPSPSAAQAQAPAPAPAELCGVLSLLARADAPHPQAPAVSQGLTATLTLIQAMADAGLEVPLWAATKGALAVDRDDDPPSPAQAGIWGLGRVAAHEYPQFWGGLADLPQGERWTGLAEALTCGESEVAVRSSGPFVRRLVHESANQSTNQSAKSGAGAGSWQPSGTVLVAGSTGALGASVARWLAAHGAGHLLIATTKEESARDLAAELTEAGTPATATAGELTNQSAVAGVLAAIPPDLPLTAVVYTGAPLDEAPLDQLTPQRLAESFASSAAEVQVLHELTADRELDAFVVFSSIAATFGGIGQGAYASANAQAAAIAEARQSRGLTGTSIAWGPWAQPDRPDFSQLQQERLSRQGISLLDPDRVLDAVRMTLDAGETATVVAKVDWASFAPLFTAATPSALLSDLPEARAPRGPAGPSVPDLRQRLVNAASSKEQRDLLTTLVRAEAAAVLGRSDPSALPEHGLLELGFDSLTSVELRNRLKRATGLALPAAAFADNPRPAQLAELLHAALTSNTEPEATTAFGGETLTPMFGQALAQGRGGAFIDLLGQAAQFRPTFTQPDDPGALPQPVALATSGTGLHLVCLPSVLAASGPHQFARFAAALRGEHRVTALRLPGFVAGEPLPASLEALLPAVSTAVSAVAADEPFALVGYSSGGLLAHAVAGQLGARALVLLDSRPLDRYTPADYAQLLDALTTHAEVIDDTRLTAMGAYLRFLHDLRPEPTTIPTLLVAAAEPLAAADTAEPAPWPLPHTEVTAPGNHFSLIEDHAATTAEAVRGWLPENGGQP